MLVYVRLPCVVVLARRELCGFAVLLSLLAPGKCFDMELQLALVAVERSFTLVRSGDELSKWRCLDFGAHVSLAPRPRPHVL